MSEDKKKKSSNRIDDKQRFNYIGFEVFPGTAKDLFKNDADKAKYVDSLLARRKKGELIREDCTLMEERVGLIDRVILTAACVAILITLFVPWYSVYNAIEETYSEPVQAIADSLDVATADSLGDSLGVMASTDSLGDTTAMLASATVEDEAAAGTTDGEAVSDEATAHTPSAASGSKEEVLHGYIAKKKYVNVYENLNGIGGLISIGSVGSYLFSSGIVLMLTALMGILMTLLAIGLPLYTLYGIWGGKGTSDQQALVLKKILRLSWLPLVLFVAAMFVSFFGAEYGFDAETMYTSLGNSYSIGTFLGSLSWGFLTMLGASILVAAKGSEI